MSGPTLQYFDIAALGSPLRLAFAVTGQPFKDERVKDWPKTKDSMPMGQMPVLTLEDGYPLTQCTSILEYIADKAGWTPQCPVAAAKVRSILQCVWDLHKVLGKYLYASEAEKPALKEPQTQAFIAMSKKLDALVARTEKDGFFLGNGKDTVADLILADYTFQAPYMTNPFDRVQVFKENAPTIYRIAERFRKTHKQHWDAQKPAYVN